MTTFRAWFYKGTRPGIPGIYNRLVRRRFCGRYSHVELQFPSKRGLSASASFEDGGVRFKQIEFNPEKWDYLDLPAEWESRALEWFEIMASHGVEYDLMGNVHLAIGFFSHSPNKFFCSEAVARSLGIPDSYRFEPNVLFAVLKHAVALHNFAKQQKISYW